MPRLLRHRISTDKYAKKEVSVAEHLPYDGHWNRTTIRTKKNELMQVVKFTGFSFETADDEDVDIRKTVRNLLFKGMASGSYGLYFHIIRRKQPIIQDIFSQHELPSQFATQVAEAWHRKHSSKQGYINELYMTIIRKADTKGVALLEHVLKKIEQTADKGAWEKEMQTAFEELDEMTTRVITTLRDYSPELLGVVDSPTGPYCQILSFLSQLVNCGAQAKVRVPSTMTLDHYLPNHRLYFGHKSIEVRGPSGSRYAGIVSIKEYGPHTSAGLLDGFLQLPCEFIISQSFTFTNRQVAIASMQLQQNRMIQAEDKAISQVAEITRALDMAMGGDIGFGLHHLTVMCIEDTPKQLENSLSMAVVELANTGSNAVRERVNMEPCFWGQLPGNTEYLVRKATINTLNLSGFSSLHNYPTGKATGNHWGEAVTVFDTTSGTPYYFNFHVRDVGHTTIIGPTGAGKTVLMNFLCAQAQKYKARMFFFDKDRGAEIFIRALGGIYTIIDPGKDCGFNPLQLEDTSTNRAFLTDWFKQLVSVNNEPIKAHEVALINDTINGNFKLERNDRYLTNVVPFLGIGGPDTLAGRISMWHGKGSHAKVFDSVIDRVDFSKSSVFGFEMGELLKDKASLGPVLSYLFHRISISLDGTPTMIVLDEAWALIDNPVFAPKIKDWLKVLRKLNCFVIFATQSVEDASKSAISDTLIQQTATQIFLPNLKATEEYRRTFMLSEREFILIKNTDPSSRFFLVKQGTSAVIARIDLSGMTDIINVLSGRAETVTILDEIRKEVGDNPDDWLPLFCERVKKHA